MTRRGTAVCLEASPVCKDLLTAEAKASGVHQVSAEAVFQDAASPSLHRPAGFVLPFAGSPSGAALLLETSNCKNEHWPNCYIT